VGRIYGSHDVSRGMENMLRESYHLRMSEMHRVIGLLAQGVFGRTWLGIAFSQRRALGGQRK
jgi:hypothetical protein